MVITHALQHSAYMHGQTCLLTYSDTHKEAHTYAVWLSKQSQWLYCLLWFASDLQVNLGPNTEQCSWEVVKKRNTYIMESSHSADSQVKLCIVVYTCKFIQAVKPTNAATVYSDRLNSSTHGKNAALQPINHTGKHVDSWCNNNCTHFYQNGLLQKCSSIWHERNDEVCLGLCWLLHVRGLHEDTVLVSCTVTRWKLSALLYTNIARQLSEHVLFSADYVRLAVI